MKKIIYSLLFLCILIIPTNKVFAVSGNVNLNCTPSSAYPNDIITCIIAADVEDGSISDFTATTKLSENLEFVGAQIVSGWTGSSDSGVFNLKTKTAQSASFEIASFTVKLSSDFSDSGTITLTPTKLGEVADLQPVSANISLANSTQTTTTETTEQTTTTDIKNPDTGSNIPFMIIGSGLIIGIVGYEVFSKRKKIYKI